MTLTMMRKACRTWLNGGETPGTQTSKTHSPPRIRRNWTVFLHSMETNMAQILKIGERQRAYWNPIMAERLRDITMARPLRVTTLACMATMQIVALAGRPETT